MATTTAVRPVDPASDDFLETRQWTVGKVVNRVLFWILVVFIIFYTIFPFLWALISSIKPNAELFTTPVQYWPSALNWTFYQFVLDNGDFLRALQNSVIVSVATVAISSLSGPLRLRDGSFAVPGQDSGPLPHPLNDDVPADRHSGLALPDD